MKKIFLLTVLVLSIVLTGCKKDNDTQANSLAGTKWTVSSSGSEVQVLEFTSASSVIFYYADKQMNISGSPKHGTYTVVDNDVKFSLSFNHNIIWTTKLMQGVISGNFMDVSRKTYIDTEDDYLVKDTYQKK